MNKYLDRYYILGYQEFPYKTIKSLRGIGIPDDLMKVVTSTDDPNLSGIKEECKAEGLPGPLVFDREKFLHDRYLSLMPERVVRKRFPKTDTPARRFISYHEHKMHKRFGLRVYAVMDDDISFRRVNPFRRDQSVDFDHKMWDRSRKALSVHQVWSCTFVIPFTFSASRDSGLEILNSGDFSQWNRKSASSNQSIWILQNDEYHQWYSPIVCDYITSARYAAIGRTSVCMTEYANVGNPNTDGAIWSRDDPADRNNQANHVAAQRILGCSYRKTGNKPYIKNLRYTYPHQLVER